MIKTISFVIAVLTLATTSCLVRADNSELPQKAQSILNKYCAECHLASGEGGFDYVTDLAKLVQGKKVVASNPSASRILKLMKEPDPESRMPKSYASKPKMEAEEIASIEAWIADGAKPYVPDSSQTENDRSLVSNAQVLQTIHRHLSKLDVEDRPFQRYFTLHHLHNLPAGEFSTAQLRNLRAATSKVLNSLSWRSEVVLPKPIDEQQTVMVFDLRDIDWDAEHSADRINFWQHLLDGYPYGLAMDRFPDDRASRQLAGEVYRMVETKLPFIRADWFVANASRPPYYHLLLYDLVLPNIARRTRVEVDNPDGGKLSEFAMTAKDLEAFLRVDIGSNIRRNRVARSGYSKSNVSSGSRMLERHPALFGAYWKSYDFTRKNIDQDVLRKPLGPRGVFRAEIAGKSVFQHDGGEIIFNLPNGLQGYLLVNDKDQRLVFGPPSLVSDGSRALGNAQIINGVSCMYCHVNGMIRGFQDEVRFGAKGLSTASRDAMLRLYLDPADFNLLQDKDEKRYMTAVEQAIKPYLLPSDYTAGFSEPIKPVAQRYMTNDLSLAEIAAELDVDEAKLKVLIEANDSLRRKLGLAGVAGGGKIKRAAWETGTAMSLFQSTAMELQVGSPENVNVR